MFSNLLQRVKSGVSKTIGAMREPVRRLGQIASSVGRGIGAVGSFVAQHHQPLALALKGAADMSGNATFKNIADMGLMGSAVATGLGIGKDYKFYQFHPNSNIY